MKKTMQKAKRFFEGETGMRLAMAAFAAAPPSPDAASDINTAIGGKVNIILNVLGSSWVRGIACIALVAECIAMLTAGRQEPACSRSSSRRLRGLCFSSPPAPSPTFLWIPAVRSTRLNPPPPRPHDRRRIWRRSLIIPCRCIKVCSKANSYSAFRKKRSSSCFAPP